MLARSLFVFLIFSVFSTKSIGQFVDDFSDGDFTSNPSWAGMDSHFIVNASNQLQLNAPAVTSESYLYTNSTSISNAVWEFTVELDFNPSSGNRAFIYLTSNQQDLIQALEGYYVLVGNSTDEISLYRQNGSSGTEIIDGIDDWVDVSNPKVKVRVTRDASGNWELFADTSAAFTGYTSMGSVFDNTHVSSNYFGLRCDYTSTRSDKFFFDDFSVTQLPDTDGPGLDSLVVVSPSTLRLYFNEPLNQSSAETPQNYSVNNGVGNPANANYNGVTEVQLNFVAPLQQGQTYILEWQNILDTLGNNSGVDTASFVVPLALNPGDVIINELLADPSPAVGLPEVEFVEIYNTTASSIPLGSVTFSDRSSTATLPNVLLQANGYVVLCDEDDTALFAGFGQVVGLSTWPTLNNSDDDLTLAYNGLVLDEVRYNTSWYDTEEKRNGGWSLELVNPEAVCSGKDNWRESEDSSGGTPGGQNSVYDTSPDITSPSVMSVSTNPPNEILVTASEQLETSSPAGINATITPNVGTLTLNFTAQDELQIITQNPLLPGVVYTLELSGLSDCAGNVQSTSFKVELGIGIEAKPYDLLINEIFAIPGNGVQQEEFVELYNRSDSLINIENLFFSDASSGVGLPSINVPPQSYVVLLGGQSTGTDPYLVNGSWFVPLSGFPSLNNSGDDLTVANSLNGEVIHAVSYSSAWYRDQDKASGEYSLELINPLAVCEGSSNWREPAFGNHSMGLENTNFNASQPNPIIWTSAQITGDSAFVLQASGSIGDQNIGITISPDLGVGSFSAIDATSAAFEVEVLNPFDANTIYQVTVTGSSDCEDKPIVQAQFELRIPSNQDVVVNEVLFNPYTGASDFVELYNRSSYPIDLKNWTLDFLNSDDERDFRTLVDTSFVLDAGGYVVFTEDRESVVLNYPNAVENRVFETDLPTYPNDEGRVTLVSNLVDTIDDFSYREDFHFELLRDVDGVSLERIDPNRLTNDPTNWHSASENVDFATPGYENSQFNLAAIADEVTVSPETFSPDQDGVDDVVTISFKLAENGFVANVKVYDPDGRVVRDLANNRLLGKTDAISWDGIRDDAQKADIGIYLLFIELYDLNGEVKYYKKTCALATRF